MIILLLELIFWIIVMYFIDGIGIVGSCICCTILNLVNSIYMRGSLSGVFEAIVCGVVSGVIVYFMAKFGLFIINILGAIGTVLIGAIFVLLLLAIIL